MVVVLEIEKYIFNLNETSDLWAILSQAIKKSITILDGQSSGENLHLTDWTDTVCKRHLNLCNRPFGVCEVPVQDGQIKHRLEVLQ